MKIWFIMAMAALNYEDCKHRNWQYFWNCYFDTCSWVGQLPFTWNTGCWFGTPENLVKSSVKKKKSLTWLCSPAWVLCSLLFFRFWLHITKLWHKSSTHVYHEPLISQTFSQKLPFKQCWINVYFSTMEWLLTLILFVESNLLFLSKLCH